MHDSEPHVADGPRDRAGLKEENRRLLAENERLRSALGAMEAAPAPPADERKPLRILLIPDPLAPPKPGQLGPDAVTNIARTIVSMLQEREPEFLWRAEHDLSQIPEEAECFQLGQVIARLWDGIGPPPMLFRVDPVEGGEPRLKRCPVAGDRAGDRFLSAYDRQIQTVDDLMLEAEAAFAAGARHHGTWTLKAIDLVLANLKVAAVRFEAGDESWRDAISTPRPEYDPRYQVAADRPAGL